MHQARVPHLSTTSVELPTTPELHIQAIILPTANIPIQAPGTSTMTQGMSHDYTFLRLAILYNYFIYA